MDGNYKCCSFENSMKVGAKAKAHRTGNVPHARGTWDEPRISRLFYRPMPHGFFVKMSGASTATLRRKSRDCVPSAEHWCCRMQRLGLISGLSNLTHLGLAEELGVAREPEGVEEPGQDKLLLVLVLLHRPGPHLYISPDVLASLSLLSANQVYRR